MLHAIGWINADSLTSLLDLPNGYAGAWRLLSFSFPNFFVQYFDFTTNVNEHMDNMFLSRGVVVSLLNANMSLSTWSKE